MKPVDQRLEVKDDGGLLTITIGMNSLLFAVLGQPGRGLDNLHITNEQEVYAAIINELMREAEDGSTLIHYALDAAFIKALDDGCEGVEEREEDAND